MNTSRRGIFGLFAGLAALPLASKLPAMPVEPKKVPFNWNGYDRPLVSAKVEEGKVVSVTVVNSGTGYTGAPYVSFLPKAGGIDFIGR